MWKFPAQPALPYVPHKGNLPLRRFIKSSFLYNVDDYISFIQRAIEAGVFFVVVHSKLIS